MQPTAAILAAAVFALRASALPWPLSAHNREDLSDPPFNHDYDYPEYDPSMPPTTTVQVSDYPSGTPIFEGGDPSVSDYPFDPSVSDYPSVTPIFEGGGPSVSDYPFDPSVSDFPVSDPFDPSVSGYPTAEPTSTTHWWYDIPGVGWLFPTNPDVVDYVEDFEKVSSLPYYVTATGNGFKPIETFTDDDIPSTTYYNGPVETGVDYIFEE